MINISFRPLTHLKKIKNKIEKGGGGSHNGKEIKIGRLEIDSRGGEEVAMDARIDLNLYEL